MHSLGTKKSLAIRRIYISTFSKYTQVLLDYPKYTQVLSDYSKYTQVLLQYSKNILKFYYTIPKYYTQVSQ